jgi:predicted nucleotidyltransferase
VGWIARNKAARSVRSPSIDRDAAIALLRAHENELKQLGVKSLYLFGSTARGEARPDPDVDLFFDDDRGACGLFDYERVAPEVISVLVRHGLSRSTSRIIGLRRQDAIS